MGAVPAAGVELTPADDIQKALDAAAPGDTIVLQPGVYYQNLVITRGGIPGKPITLSVVKGGSVTLSGAVPPADGLLKFERVEGDLYRAAVTSRVWWAMAGSRNLLNYGTLDHLTKFKFPNLYARNLALGPCVPEGFAWQNGFLYVRMEGGTDPNAAAIEVSRPGGHSTAESEFSTRDASLSFWVPGSMRMLCATLANIDVRADHVVIEGLRLRLGVGAAVVVRGNEVTIRDCAISGAYFGVLQPDTVAVPARGSPRPIGSANHTARGLTVEFCDFSGYPCCRWKHFDPKYWDTLYHGSLAATFMNYGGPRSVCRNNWLYECFDGLEPRGNGTDTSADACEIACNLIQNCADDSIEFDSSTPMNLRVHRNVILDGMCLLALSPVMGGGLTIDHNILYISPEQGFQWSVFFKFGSPWGSGLPTQGARIFHNTMVNTHRWIYWCGEDHRYENMAMENNVFYCAEPRGWGLKGFVPSRNNLYCGPKIGSKDIPEMMHDPLSPFVSMNPMDFTLRADGPAVDAGVAGKDYDHKARGKAPDLGAIELGDAWEFPRPGPRWAKDGEIANRPAIPASLPLKWVGME
jgi:hypothetical protein